MTTELRQKIYQTVRGIVADPGMQQRLLEMGGEINNRSPAEFQKVIDAEVKNWAEAVKLSGARVD